MQATGYVDAAVRAVKKAEDFEAQKDLKGAIKQHQQASELYKKATMTLKLRKSKTEAEGNVYPKSEVDNDAKTIASFN